MDIKTLQLEMVESFEFLKTEYSYSIFKNEYHWLGGIEIEYKKDDLIVNLLYDNREQWFSSRLYSKNQEKKVHMYLIGELRKLFCSSLSSPSVSLENDKAIVFFLHSFSNCLRNNHDNILDNFLKGNYVGGNF